MYKYLSGGIEMKNSAVKKALSVFLCALLVALCVMPAFAENAKAKYPVLFVEGFNGAPLYKGGTDKVFMPEAKDLTGVLTTVIPALLKFAAAKDMAALQGDIDGQAKAYDDFITAMVSAVDSVYSKIACDEDGNSLADDIDVLPTDAFGSGAEVGESNIQEAVIPKAAEALGNDMVYYFTYDWRMSLIDTAAKLDAAVKEIKSITGADKVSLMGMSMGGALINTYTTIYGYDDICNLTMSSSAFKGLQYIGEIFTGNMELDGEKLAELIDDFLREDISLSGLLKYSNVLKKLINDMNEAFAYDSQGTKALGAGDDTATEPKNRIREEILIPYFATTPGMWTFVPEEYFADAINYVFVETGRTLSSASLIMKLTEYYSIQKGAKANLQRAMNNGVTVSVVSHYNVHVAPVTPKAKSMTGDVTIETVGTSGGATCAPIGETFADGYTQAKFPEKNYISPDNMIDASTCMFPEQTWFIKNMKHMEFDMDGNNTNLFIWLVTATEQYTVETYDLYPQFLFYDRTLKRLSCFYTLGDVNYDDEISLVDVRKALRLAEGLDESNANLEAPADFNHNGEVTKDDSQGIINEVVRLWVEKNAPAQA
jgi:hypothetical protein